MTGRFSPHIINNFIGTEFCIAAKLSCSKSGRKMFSLENSFLKSCFGTSSKVITEIDDLQQRAPNKYNEIEANTRKKLASLYRLVDLMGWSESVYNHMTSRVPGRPGNFLIIPFGLLYHEVTASSLLEVDGKTGHVTDPGSTNFGYIDRAYTLHSAILQARPDVNCVLHLHIPEVMAISVLPDGFVPFSQESLFIGPVSTYDFRGILRDYDEKDAIVKCLGSNNVLLLRNHGFVACGEDVEQAFFRTYALAYHVKAQAYLSNVPKASIIMPTEEAARMSYEGLKNGEFSGVDSQGQPVHWKQGELDWQAYMRLLDNLAGILFLATLTHV